MADGVPMVADEGRPTRTSPKFTPVLPGALMSKVSLPFAAFGMFWRFCVRCSTTPALTAWLFRYHVRLSSNEMSWWHAKGHGVIAPKGVADGS